MWHDSVGEGVYTHVRLLIRSLGGPEQGEAQGVLHTRPAIFTVIEHRQAPVMLRDIRPLVATDLVGKGDKKYDIINLL